MIALALALAVPAPAVALSSATPAPVVLASVPPPPEMIPLVVPPNPAQTGPLNVIARAPTPGDPNERFNRRMFDRQMKLDRQFIGPAATGYTKVVPKFLRTMLRNFFSNLDEPIVFVNYLLQLKPGKAVETVGRFTINSTLGLGGTIDIAKEPGIALPHRNNGLANTLGYYGVKPGSYFFLPLVGPTTVRDFIGGQIDGLILPLAIGSPFSRLEYQIPRAILTGLDLRAESDADLKALLDGAVDPYATLRSVYLQDREGEIAALHGKREAAPNAASPDDPLSDPLADPAATSAGSAPASTAPELRDSLADPAQPAAPAASAPATPDASPSASPELEDPLADPGQPSPAAPATPARR